MKKLLLIFLLAFSLTSCLIIQPQKVKAQDYIAWVNQPILEAGGYGMLYNWFCTQEQAAVEYGYLYNWYAATDSRNICSVGWHIPTSTEMALLRTYSSPSPSLKLKEVGLIHWNSPNSGTTNKFGFNGVGSGERIFNTGSFSNIKIYLYIWESTGTCNYSRIDYSSGDFIAYSSSTLGRTKGLSIRPIKDSTTLTHGQTGIYVDPSGIIYPTICIGTQEWVACNIMTKHYRNGDAIPEVTDNTAWAGLTTGARCSYNNLESNAESTKKLSSSDEWVVPDDSDWGNLLSNYTDGEVAGNKLKEVGLVHWDQTSVLVTNESGFTGLGSGVRWSEYYFFKTASYYWSRGDYYPCKHYFYLSSENLISNFTQAKVDTDNTPDSGCSVRLLYTGSGTPTTYTGNDGTIYPVVLIGTQYWLAQNLKETKWSDGTDIPNVTDNTAWSLLQSAACCDINNDPTKR